MEKKKHSPYSPHRVALGWVGGLLMGWILSGVIGFSIIQSLSLFINVLSASPTAVLLSIALVFVGLYVCGSIAGYVEWRMSLRHLVSESSWRRATVLSTFLLLIVVAYTLSSSLLNPCSGIGEFYSCKLSPKWFIEWIACSVGAGLALSLPQWWELRQTFPNAYLWPVANVISTGLALINAIRPTPGDLFTMIFVIVSVYIGITSITLYVLVNIKQENEKSLLNGKE